MTSLVDPKQPNAATAATAYDLDADHSQAEFAVKHMMIATVRGRIPIVKGTIVRGPQGWDVDAELDVARIDTGAAQRDEHLRSPDFFDAPAHPRIVFRARGVQEGDAKVVGDLTIRGVTRSVLLDVERNGEGKDPWGNRRVGLAATTTLNRHDWGLNWNVALEAGGVLVGDKVKVTLDLQAVERRS